MTYEFDPTLIDAWEIANRISENMGYGAIPTPNFFIAVLSSSYSRFYLRLNRLQELNFTSESFLSSVSKIVYDSFDIEHKFPTASVEFINGSLIYIQQDIVDILELAYMDISYRESKQINVDDIIYVISILYPDVYTQTVALLHCSDVNSLLEATPHEKEVYQELAKYESLLFGLDEESTAKAKFTLPENVSGFLRVLNEQYSPESETCPIGGRESEVQHLTTILMKNKKRNCILIGDAGVGKTAIVEKFVWEIVTGNSFAQFKDSIVLELDITSIIADTRYRGDAEKRFADLIDFLKNNPNCILFIDEIHLLLGAGSCGKDDPYDLANAMKPLLAGGSTRVIGATTIVEYEKYFAKDVALNRRFDKIMVKEPHFKDIPLMIKNQIKNLETAHGVSITPKMVKSAILYSSCFNFEAKNPDKTLDLIDQAMANAELAGKTKVQKCDILGTFDIYTKKFKKMTIEQKNVIAYHEAGHYILYKFSKNLSDQKLLAVSIMPADNYLGVTVSESDDESVVNDNIDYYISLIAANLAGRVAEEMYTNDKTSGASEDLKSATYIAENVVTKFGFEEVLRNRVFLDKNGYTPKTAEKIEDAIDKILMKAEVRAKNMLKEYHTYLEALVDALVKKGILSEPEINKLFNEIDTKKK